MSGALGLTPGLTGLSAVAGAAQVSAALGSKFTLRLGNVLFDETSLEVPAELSDIGGSQTVVEHRFPGGIKTHQSYGAFWEPISWKGYFTGPNALNRMESVDSIRKAGNEVKLVYGPKSWLGRVSKFTPKPMTQWRVPYDITFLPRTAGPPPTSLSSLEQDIADQLSGLTSAVSLAPGGFSAQLISQAVAIGLLVSGALTRSGGLVTNISSADQAAITSSCSALSSQASQYTTNTDPRTSYAAQSMAVRSQNISLIVQTGQAPVRTIQVINPNLVSLAAQYLNDGTRWRDIAYTNGLTDMTPIGSFNLQIPAISSNPIPSQSQS